MVGGPQKEAVALVINNVSDEKNSVTVTHKRLLMG